MAPEKLSREQLWKMVRQYPEYKDGRLTEEQAEEVVEGAYADQEKILEEYLKAEISRELMRMAARGEAVYDPQTDRYAPRSVVDEEVSRGEATYDPQTGVYRRRQEGPEVQG